MRALLLLLAMISGVALAEERDGAATHAVTFNRDVAPILFANCSVCHRPGEVGPFDLLTYTDARKRARQIADVTRRRIMPPWKPEHGFGEFQFERRLTDAQLTTLAAWAKQGAPEGNPSDLPPAPKFPKDWHLGPPDLVLKMSEPFTIPAEGRDVYRHFVLPTNQTRERYLRAVEVRPGNRRVAHHAVTLVDTSGTARKLDAKSPGPGYPGLGSSGFLPAGFLPGYVPGQTPRWAHADSAIPLKANCDIVLQMHYHPTGKEERDQTSIGLYFTDKAPTKRGSGLFLGSEEIDIPPGEANYVRTDTFKLPAGIHITDIWAHMHMIGKEVKVTAKTPEGEIIPLLWIKDWDFNWQDFYRFSNPVWLPKDTEVQAVFVFDNSDNNPRNPSTPPKRVTHGEGSTDEMAGVLIGGYTEKPLDDWAMLGAIVAHFIDLKTRAGIFKAIRGIK